MSPTVFDFPVLFNVVLKYGNFMTVPTLMTRRETLDAVGCSTTSHSGARQPSFDQALAGAC